jgi:D-amino-acid oxidase
VTSASPDVFVIGAGVSGLTTGICLAEAGKAVVIQAAEMPQATTSAVAGALWGTHLVGADERVPAWADETRGELEKLAGHRGTGVHLATGLMAVRVPQETPPEVTDAADFTSCPPDELPAGYAAGWRVAAPLAAMPIYLDYLQGRFAAAGGKLLEPRSFATLAEAAGRSSAPVIVNCAGSGAYALVPDPSVTPVRGQIVVTENPGITEFFVGNGEGSADLTYFFPHEQTVVLGGTQDHGDWSRTPDAGTAEDILAACTAVEPRLAGARVLHHRVGLRPARPRVRLEAEAIAGNRHIVHNYGHGGAGISLSWACARDAAGLVAAALG